jgi:hypothetical protein
LLHQAVAILRRCGIISLHGDTHNWHWHPGGRDRQPARPGGEIAGR